MAQHIHADGIRFRQFVLKDAGNRIYLYIAFGAIILQFTIFKIIYPYANFLPDSYSYIASASSNQDISMWPVGYSKALRFFSAFTHSDTALVFIQYLFLQGAMIYLFFTLLYLFNPGKITSRILLLFLLLNPIILHVSNFVSSDAFFTGLSLLWITQLLWIVMLPRLNMMLVHAVILLVAFTVRYNALYYPLISAVVILLARLRLWHKILALTVIALLIVSFIRHNYLEYRKLTGIGQVSAFAGWQMASNALFMYAHAPVSLNDNVPKAFRQLHEVTIHHMDSLNSVAKRPDSLLGTYYLWDEHAPLKKYMGAGWNKRSSQDFFKKWASLAPLYADYGLYLIKQHPGTFFTYYVWPNIINYYVPPTEFLGIYNMGKDTVDQTAKAWFSYSSNQIKYRSVGPNIAIMELYPIAMAIINLCFFVSITGYILLNGLKNINKVLLKILSLIVLIWLSNLAFSVLSSPVVLRYQIFPMIVTFAFTLLLFEMILLGGKPKERRSEGIQEQPISIVQQAF